VPRISVIVPMYNCARFIREALASIQAQSHPPDEIIVVDDGSTDETAAIVTQIVDSRISFHRKDNGGAASARNVGLSVASGDYIAFLDADDRWHPEMLKTTVGLLNGAPEAAFCFTNFERFAEPSGASLGDQFRYYHQLADLVVQPGPLPETFVVAGEAFQALISFGDFPAFTQAMLFRRRSIGDLHFDPALRRCDDLAFTLRAALTGAVAFTPRVLAFVRRHDANLTANNERMALDKLEALQTLAPYLSSPNHQRPYRDRLVRAYFDACRTHLRHGEVSEGMRNLTSAITIPGSWGRKMRGLGRCLGVLPMALLRREGGAHG